MELTAVPATQFSIRGLVRRWLSETFTPLFKAAGYAPLALKQCEMSMTWDDE